MISGHKKSSSLMCLFIYSSCAILVPCVSLGMVILTIFHLIYIVVVLLMLLWSIILMTKGWFKNKIIQAVDKVDR